MRTRIQNPINNLSRFFRHKPHYTPVTYPGTSLQTYIKPQQIHEIFNSFTQEKTRMTQLIEKTPEKMRLPVLKEIIFKLQDQPEEFKKLQDESFSLYSKIPYEYKVDFLLSLFEKGEFLLYPTAKYFNLTEFQEEEIIKRVGETNIEKLRLQNPDFYLNFNNSTNMVRFMPMVDLPQQQCGNRM